MIWRLIINDWQDIYRSGYTDNMKVSCYLIFTLLVLQKLNLTYSLSRKESKKHDFVFKNEVGFVISDIFLNILLSTELN